MAEQKHPELNQGEGFRTLQRWITGILGYFIILMLVAVPVFSLILVVYLLFKI